jgi:hypothetical protein
MSSDDLWRSRFIVVTLARLVGLGTFFLGVAVMYTDLLRDGGWPQVGAIIAIIATLDVLLVPKILRKAWERQDRPGIELPTHEPPERP